MVKGGLRRRYQLHASEWQRKDVPIEEVERLVGSGTRLERLLG
jgi:hypothetical protein